MSLHTVLTIFEAGVGEGEEAVWVMVEEEEDDEVHVAGFDSTCLVVVIVTKWLCG